MDIAADGAAGKMVFPYLNVRQLQPGPIFQVTKRERSMPESMTEGRTNKELAAVFGISVNTVKFHVSNP